MNETELKQLVDSKKEQKLRLALAQTVASNVMSSYRFLMATIWCLL